MNKLNFGPLGGHILHQDDLEFQDNAYREAFDGILKTFSDIAFKTGVVSNNDAPGDFDIPVSWSAGFLFANGEVFKVIAGGPIDLTSDPSNGENIYFALDTFDDPAGAEFNVPGEPIQVFKIRRATVRVSTGPVNTMPDFLAIFNLPSPEDVITKKVVDCQNDTLKNKLLTDGFVNSNLTEATLNLTAQFVAVDNASQPRYHLQTNGVACLSGLARVVTTGINYQLYASGLPEALRPARSKQFIVSIDNFGDTALVTVSPTGQIFVTKKSSEISSGVAQSLIANSIVSLSSIIWIPGT